MYTYPFLWNTCTCSIFATAIFYKFYQYIRYRSMENSLSRVIAVLGFYEKKTFTSSRASSSIPHYSAYIERFLDSRFRLETFEMWRSWFSVFTFISSYTLFVDIVIIICSSLHAVACGTDMSKVYILLVYSFGRNLWPMHKIYLLM